MSDRSDNGRHGYHTAAFDVAARLDEINRFIVDQYAPARSRSAQVLRDSLNGQGDYSSASLLAHPERLKRWREELHAFASFLAPEAAASRPRGQRTALEALNMVLLHRLQPVKARVEHDNPQ